MSRRSFIYMTRAANSSVKIIGSTATLTCDGTEQFGCLVHRRSGDSLRRLINGYRDYFSQMTLHGA